MVFDKSLDGELSNISYVFLGKGCVGIHHRVHIVEIIANMNNLKVFVICKDRGDNIMATFCSKKQITHGWVIRLHTNILECIRYGGTSYTEDINRLINHI